MSPSLLLTRRQQYGAFHEALDSLYSADRLTLAQDNMPDTANLQGLFDALADLIYKDGRFTVSQLRSKEARRVIAETAHVLAEGVNTQLPTDVPDTLRYALEENTFTFSGFKAFHAMREIGLSLVAEDGNIKPFKQFKDDVKAVNDSYNVNYLRAEYQQAVGASQMAAKWVDIERDGDRYDLQYRTAQDNHVREDHALLHGTTLPPSDAFWDKYYPPNGWGCRCTVVQVRHGKYPLSDPELAMKRGDNSTAGVKQQMFRFNPGKQMKLFPPKHPYYPKNCDGCDKNGLRLAYNPQSEKCKACGIIAKCMRENLADNFETLRTYKDGAKVRVSSAIMDRESLDYRRILSVSEAFAMMGRNVDILPRFNSPKNCDTYEQVYKGIAPEYYGKCPDIKVGGFYYEHKGYVGQNPKKALRNMFLHGLIQSDRLIIERVDLTDDYILARISDKIKQGISVSEVWVHDSGSLRLLYKKK